MQYPKTRCIFVSTTTNNNTLKILIMNTSNVYFFDYMQFNNSTREYDLITYSYEFDELEEAQEFARANGYGAPYQKEVKKFLIAYQLGCAELGFYNIIAENAKEALKGLSVDFDGEITPGKPIYIGLSGDHRFNSDTLIYEYRKEDEFSLKDKEFDNISKLFSWLEEEETKEVSSFFPFEGLSDVLSITKTNNHND